MTLETNTVPSLEMGCFSSLDAPIACSSGVHKTQFRAASTAFLASMIPKPYQLLTQNPAALVTAEMSLASVTFWDVLAMIPCTSLQVSSERASSMRAITPDTTGEANDVPGPEFAHVPPRPAVKILETPLLSPAGAVTNSAAPGVEYAVCLLSLPTAPTVMVYRLF